MVLVTFAETKITRVRAGAPVSMIAAGGDTLLMRLNILLQRLN